MTSGIYMIRNTLNGKVYVGSSVNIEYRWSTHKSTLRNNKHYNSHLQRAWNKYGETAFELIILEECDNALLLEREQHWLNIHFPTGNCYNQSIHADRPSLGVTVSKEARLQRSERAKRQMSDPENRLLISRALKGKPKSLQHRLNSGKAQKGKKLSLEHRQKLSDALSGYIRSAEHRKHLSESLSSRWEVTYPSGETHIITNLKAFCTDNHLTRANMQAVARGRRVHHKGFKCRKLDE